MHTSVDVLYLTLLIIPKYKFDQQKNPYSTWHGDLTAISVFHTFGNT